MCCDEEPIEEMTTEERLKKIEEICSWDPGFEIDIEEMLHL